MDGKWASLTSRRSFAPSARAIHRAQWRSYTSTPPSLVQAGKPTPSPAVVRRWAPLTARVHPGGRLGGVQLVRLAEQAGCPARFGALALVVHMRRMPAGGRVAYALAAIAPRPRLRRCKCEALKRVTTSCNSSNRPATSRPVSSRSHSLGWRTASD
jgi:hypothetical protein